MFPTAPRERISSSDNCYRLKGLRCKLQPFSYIDALLVHFPTKELKDMYNKHSGVPGKGACELNYGKLKDKRNGKEEKLEAGKEVKKNETIKNKNDKTLK